jgi:hypothetical protein
MQGMSQGHASRMHETCAQLQVWSCLQWTHRRGMFSPWMSLPVGVQRVATDSAGGSAWAGLCFRRQFWIGAVVDATAVVLLTRCVGDYSGTYDVDAACNAKQVRGLIMSR